MTLRSLLRKPTSAVSHQNGGLPAGTGWTETYEGGSPEGMPLKRIATRRIDVSSTEIRARVRAGKSIHGFVTEAVAGFIEAAGLYRHRGTTC